MEPFLSPGSRIVGQALGASPARGSVVVFRHPLRPEMWLVKRVIGLPGEEVEIDFGEVLIDGRPGLDPWGSGLDTFPEGKWQLAGGQVLVLSDNRSATADDGRTFGPISMTGMFKIFWPRG
jgi:signal peptidase I